MAELMAVNAYSEALYAVASEIGAEEIIRQEAEILAEVFASERGLMEVFSTPALPQKEKKELLKKIFDGRVRRELLNLLYILLDKNRIRFFPQVVKEYIKTIEREKGILWGEAVSAEPLKQAQLHKLETETAKLLRVKNVKLRNKIDASLIGGVKIYADGKIIDASLRRKLDRMAKTIRP